jgi:hypothetical protein
MDTRLPAQVCIIAPMAACRPLAAARLLLALAPVYMLGCGLERIEIDPLTGAGASDVSDEPSPASATAAAGDEAVPAANEGGSLVPASGRPEGAPIGLPLDADAGVGCSQLDLLFVIDNSLSMAFAQDNLRASFPGLLDVLAETLPATDVQVMVVDTDGRDAASSDDVCDVLGAGRRTNGQSGDDCGLPATRRFATASAELEPALACMSSVGTSGEAREQQADALLAAIAPEQNDVGGCNAGFSRPGAVLVVTVITNTDDDISAGDPDAWFDAIVQHKGGNEQAVVFVGFLPGDAFSPSTSGVLCNVIARFNPAPRLEALATRFTHRQLASVCEADYGPTFASAVSSIAQACQSFVPPTAR